MKLLFVHEVSYRKKVVFEMHEFPELLAEKGHHVTFFDFDEGARFWSGGLSPKKQIISGRVRPDKRLTVVRAFQLGMPGFDRLLATLTSWNALWRTMSRGNFDAVVLLAVPTYGVQTILLARVFGLPVVFRALDVSHKIRNNIFSAGIRQIERFIYKRADLVLGNNPAMTAYCASLGDRVATHKASATVFAPLDLEHFRAAKPDSGLRSALGIEPEDRVITYMGSFFYFSGLEEVIKAFANASNSGLADGSKLLLIGGGEQDGELRSLVANLGLSDAVIFTGFVDYQALPRYLDLTTVAINPLRKSLVTDTALPHKVLQYLAMGLPVVSSRLDGLRQVFGDDSGITWADNPNDILLSALGHSNNSSLTSNAAMAARAAVATRMEQKVVVDQFEKLLETTIRKRT